jgi:hypothetical protein
MLKILIGLLCGLYVDLQGWYHHGVWLALFYGRIQWYTLFLILLMADWHDVCQGLPIGLTLCRYITMYGSVYAWEYFILWFKKYRASRAIYIAIISMALETLYGFYTQEWPLKNIISSGLRDSVLFLIGTYITKFLK